MLKFKRILVPTDFSPATSPALDYAIALSLQHEASLMLLHVVQDIGFTSPFSLVSSDTSCEYRHGLEDEVRGRLEAVVSSQLKRQIPVKEMILFGRPCSAIVRTAEECQVDLIVIPSHSRPAGTAAHLGSTTERVVKLAPCPVLVIRDIRPHASGV